MHALAFLSLVASTALVAAQDEYASFQPLSTSFSTLQARQQQSCASVGGKTCGAKCIQLSYTCCGNGAGACEVGYTCGLAANGIYGCCPLGKRCRGDAPDPSTTDIGVARPTTVRGGGAGDVNDGDDETTTPAVETTTRRLTPTSTPARTTAVISDDTTTTSSSTTSRSASTTRSSAVASGTSSSSVNGAGSDSNSNSNGNSNANGSGSSSTAGSGGNGSQASSAGIISVGLASLAGGFIAAIASLL
ncbi:hypothetical protein BBO_06510 [Beauveria brongniartii RCEF 3172]|uniref:GPI anchored serine-threonine rich protein n=1 Tax=Beauveria brongniartii RCEF 3172 TaxID=1081107 RepID=A0A167B136_9HYPO|nr:hypothetical protein BBO_06510 [Beauveria brongniartii RCEF 3172]